MGAGRHAGEGISANDEEGEVGLPGHYRVRVSDAGRVGRADGDREVRAVLQGSVVLERDTCQIKEFRDDTFSTDRCWRARARSRGMAACRRCAGWGASRSTTK